jgi:hypothetical protein
MSRRLWLLEWRALLAFGITYKTSINIKFIFIVICFCTEHSAGRNCLGNKIFQKLEKFTTSFLIKELRISMHHDLR